MQDIRHAGFVVLVIAVLVTTATSCLPRASTANVEYISVVAGARHTCALTRAGAAYCWGFNGSGQLGTGNTTASNRPVPVSGGLVFTQLSATYDHTCGVSAGAVWCWGTNAHGEVGDMMPAPGVRVPTRAQLPSDLTMRQVSAGFQATCALATSAQLFCWGDAFVGKLGVGNGIPSQPIADPLIAGETAPPTLIPGLYRSVSIRGDDGCAITTSNNVACWGDNTWRQLGKLPDETCPSPNPAQTIACGRSPVRVSVGAADGLAVGWYFACITAAYDVSCWGSNLGETIAPKGTGLPECEPEWECTAQWTLRPRPMAGTTRLGYVDIAVGRFTACASVYPIGNSVVCWGANNVGQLGDGSNIDRTQPTPLAVPLGALSIAVGESHTCLVTDGSQAYRIYCWGSNGSGQLGNGARGASENRPQLVVEP